MKLLAIDTTTTHVVLGLAIGDRAVEHVADSREGGAGRARHAEVLLPSIAALFEAASASPRELAGVVVGVGPGSFVGTRIGVAAAKGLAVSLGIPLVGVGTLQAIAAGVGGRGTVVVLGDAHRGELTVLVVRAGVPTAPPIVLTPAAAIAHLARELQGTSVVLVGPGARLAPALPAALASSEVHVSLADPDLDLPTPTALLDLGRAKLAAGASEVRELDALYARAPDVT